MPAGTDKEPGSLPAGRAARVAAGRRRQASAQPQGPAGRGQSQRPATAAGGQPAVRGRAGSVLWRAGSGLPYGYGAWWKPAFSASEVVRNHTSARVSRKFADSLVK
ncbi:hypothetical protein GCM10009634_24590 [Saccharothrix xinjiangensis]